ncbi:MAG: hypothetical protein WAQ33_02455 [Gaiellaceae bacterium]
MLSGLGNTLGEPVWSPDSSKLLVAAQPASLGSCSSLWLVDAKTGAAHEVRRCD